MQNPDCPTRRAEINFPSCSFTHRLASGKVPSFFSSKAPGLGKHNWVGKTTRHKDVEEEAKCAGRRNGQRQRWGWRGKGAAGEELSRGEELPATGAVYLRPQLCTNACKQQLQAPARGWERREGLGNGAEPRDAPEPRHFREPAGKQASRRFRAPNLRSASGRRACCEAVPRSNPAGQGRSPSRPPSLPKTRRLGRARPPVERWVAGWVGAGRAPLPRPSRARRSP